MLGFYTFIYFKILCYQCCLLLTPFYSVSLGVPYSYVQGQARDEDTTIDVKLHSHRWRRWLPPKPRNMDSNRASQEQDQEPEQEEPEGFPGLLSAEEADNSSQIEVSKDLYISHAADLGRPVFKKSRTVSQKSSSKALKVKVVLLCMHR